MLMRERRVRGPTVLRGSSMYSLIRAGSLFSPAGSTAGRVMRGATWTRTLPTASWTLLLKLGGMPRAGESTSDPASPCWSASVASTVIRPPMEWPPMKTGISAPGKAPDSSATAALRRAMKSVTNESMPSKKARSPSLLPWP